MDILPFDEGLSHREIVAYRPIYKQVFENLKAYVEAKLPEVSLIHIGSTAVPDLRGKPMLDVIAISTVRDLRNTQKDLEQLGFQRRDVWTDRDDKPYVCAATRHDTDIVNVNIHVCGPNHQVLKDALRFIDQLNSSANNRREYEKAKDRAHSIDPANPQIYNQAKQNAILKIQGKD